MCIKKLSTNSFPTKQALKSLSTDKKHTDSNSLPVNIQKQRRPFALSMTFSKVFDLVNKASTFNDASQEPFQTISPLTKKKLKTTDHNLLRYNSKTSKKWKRDEKNDLYHNFT